VSHTEELDIVGQVISGKIGQIFVREKAGAEIELGNLLVAQSEDGSSLILQVHGLSYGSQIPPPVRELAAGRQLEGQAGSLSYYDPNIRNYTIAEMRAVAKISESVVSIPKTLPGFFSLVRHVNEEDFNFLNDPQNTVYLGKVRSGSKTLNVDVKLNGQELFTHHVLISATTGRGKSNLVKILLWSIVDDDDLGVLVLDPHDEYFGGRDEKLQGLSQHPSASRKVRYYSVNPTVGSSTLMINLKSVMPWHLESIFSLTQAQHEGMYEYYFKHLNDKQWIKAIVKGESLGSVQPITLNSLQRKFRTILGLDKDENGELICYNRAFSDASGEATVSEIIKNLEEGKIVIIDTSRLSDAAELLIGSLVIRDIVFKYQKYRAESGLKGKPRFEDKPVISIVLEEAPRVLASDTLEQYGDNAYSTVAREGRKFKIGLLAVTQLTSVIPPTILANLNTKIIFGNEMASERRAVINSAAQDLTEDYVTIGSLDRGEAIVSSIFTKFAIPIKVPLFDNFLKEFSSNRNLNSSEDKHAIRDADPKIIP